MRIEERPQVFAWRNALLLMLLIAHAMVFGLSFKGGHELKKDKSWWRVLIEEGTVSYLVALLLSAFLLWVFERIGPDTGLTASLHRIVALGFVTALGSAAGRLLI